MLTMSVLIATVQTASAETYDPYTSGNNAAGYGDGFTENDFHDIDRKVCGFWGCNYRDGANGFYNSDGTGTNQCSPLDIKQPRPPGPSGIREIRSGGAFVS